jgi:hypothetical protein
MHACESRCVVCNSVAPRTHGDEMDSLTRRTVMRAMDGNVLFVGLSRQHKELIVSEMYPMKIRRVSSLVNVLHN